MTFDQIKERAERFFEWPGEERKTVTYTSALLFAQSVANDAAECMKNLAIQQNDMETIGQHPDSLVVKKLDASTARIRALRAAPLGNEASGVSDKIHAIIEMCEAYQNNDVECDVEECYQLSKDVIRAANAILALIPSPPNIGEGERVCEWTYDHEDRWDSSCGTSWTFISGGPEENGVKFCHGCGKRLKVKE